MLSDLYFILLDYHLKIAFLSGATPLHLNKTTHHFHPSTFSTFRFRYLIFPGFILFSIFSVTQTIRLFLRDEIHTLNFYFTYIYTICAVVSTVAISVFYFKPVSLATSINCLFDTLFYIQRHYIRHSHYSRNKSSQSRLHDKLIILVQIFANFTALLSSLHYVFFPDCSIYVINELPRKIQVLPVAKLIMLIIMFIGNYTVWNSAATFFMLGITYQIYYIPLITSELDVNHLSSSPEYLTKRKFRHPKTLRLVYRQLEILHYKLLDQVSYMLVPANFLMGKWMVFSGYVLIHHQSHLETLIVVLLVNWLTTGMFMWTKGLQVTGQVHDQSRRTIESWKRKNWGTKWQTRVMIKWAKACQPLTIGFGKSFVVKRLAALKFIKGVSRGTFRALLMTTKGR